jgi:hypothetical protein
MFSFVVPHVYKFMSKMSVIVVSYLLMCCSSPRDAKNEPLMIDQANWLVGVWNFESNGKQAYEMWKQVNDSIYAGKSYSLVDGDTISSEYMKLVQQSDEIYYIPTVVGQNTGRHVTFKLTLIHPGKLVFENPAHDFPQVIVYEKISDDSLVAQVSGMMKGEYRALKYPMRRLK